MRIEARNAVCGLVVSTSGTPTFLQPRTVSNAIGLLE
jgi:hypothetical protein